nr:hypothetical protein [Angustibacter aerolatus]
MTDCATPSTHRPAGRSGRARAVARRPRRRRPADPRDRRPVHPRGA